MKSPREQSVDEFEALFERASIPVLDIREIDLTRISLVLKGDSLDDSILRLGTYLRDRFGSHVEVHWPHQLDASALLEQARDAGIEPADEPFHSTAELVGQVSIRRQQLLVVPEPADDARRVLDLGLLIQGARPPIMLVRTEITDPAQVFTHILHSLTGNFRQTQNFAYSFTLVADAGGRLTLLHTIDESDLEDVKHALQLSPNVPAAGREELLERLAQQGERYLSAVVAASRKYPYHVGYRLLIGEVVPTVRQELARGNYTLLVVGCHRAGHSLVEAADYELMREIRHLPVLAL